MLPSLEPYREGREGLLQEDAPGPALWPHLSTWLRESPRRHCLAELLTARSHM